VFLSVYVVGPHIRKRERMALVSVKQVVEHMNVIVRSWFRRQALLIGHFHTHKVGACIVGNHSLGVPETGIKGQYTHDARDPVQYPHGEAGIEKLRPLAGSEDLDMASAFNQ